MGTKISLAILLAVSTSFSLSLVMAQEDSRQLVDIGNSALWVEIIDDKVYVSNPQDGKIVIIDVNTNKIIDTIEAAAGVGVLEVVSEKNKMYATVLDSNKVIVFDLVTHKIIKEVDIGEPQIVQFSKSDKPYGEREYVYFNTNAIGLKYNSNNEMLYAVHSTVNHINVIDTNSDTVVGTIPVGKTPLLIEIDESSNTGYVTNWESNDVTVINLDSNEVTDNLRTGWVPDQMELDQTNHRLFVTHHASPYVSVIDLRDKSIEAKIQLKSSTHAVALDSMNNLLHVTYTPTSAFTGSASINRVEFVDPRTNANVGGFDIDANPFTIDIDSENHKLFATVIATGDVIALDLSKDPRYLKVLEERETKPASTSGGGCLIATATFGSELAPQVQQLRELRDNVLLQTESGSAFINGFNDLYYTFSPTVADWERKNPAFKEAVKLTITPMITSLSLLNYADMNSESEVLGYGIGLILLNIGMYVGAPVGIGLFLVSKKSKNS